MVFARIVYKKKSGYSVGKYAYVCSEDLDTIVEYAKKNSRKREFIVQPDLMEGDLSDWKYHHEKVLNLETGGEEWHVLEGKFGAGPGTAEKYYAGWIRG